nr:WYL domain-containing protein [Bacillus sp. COPE52]
MGATVEVIKPDSLRDDMIKEGRKLLELYEK